MGLALCNVLIDMHTCVTLTAEPFAFADLPRDVAYLNYVSVFKHHSDIHAARMDAILRVKTSHFCFQDDDDPLPSKYPADFKGICFGDMWVLDARSGQQTRTKADKWSPDVHMQNPLLIHKAFCETRPAKILARLLPRGFYNTEALLYYFLAKYFGKTYDKDLVMTWNMRQEGWHNGCNQGVVNSVDWIKQNETWLVDQIPKHLL